MQSKESAEIVKRDRFASAEYNDQEAYLPRIQALRGSSDKSCGYFIPEKEMEKAGWRQVNAEDLIVYTYESGGMEKGVFFHNPRMLVVQRSPLLALDRQASKREKKTVIVGEYNKADHGGPEGMGICMFYEVLMLDKKNNPLHEIPFRYIAKGANQVSFSTHWQQLVSEVTRCHARANKIAFRPKNAEFASLCVLDFLVARELAGGTMKSLACKVTAHHQPSQEDWENYFLGRNDKDADKFISIMAPSPGSNALALPAAATGSEESGVVIDGEVL